MLLVLLICAKLTSTSAANFEERESKHISCGGENTTSVCPPWSVCNLTSHYCRCSTQHLEYVQCGTITTKVQFCHCLTYEYNEYTLGKCFYNCGQSNPSDRTAAYLKLPSDPAEINTAMCGNLNRNGALCGQCQNDTSPLVYSYNVSCSKCPKGHSNWWKFVLAAFGPLTIFYLCVLLFKVSITPIYMYTFVFYAQAMSTPIFLRSTLLVMGHKHKDILTGVKVLSSIYGIWSLDFFRALYNGICLNLDTLESQALEYAIALYPLLLILLSYLLVKLHVSRYRCRCVVYAYKPFYFLLSVLNRNWDSTSSLIDAYATFFILSLTKIFFVTFDLLLPTKVYTLTSNGTLGHHWVLYFDGSKDFFGKEHFPFAILAIAVFSIFIVVPCLVLCLFPFTFFQRFLNRLHCNVAPLRLFVDKFQGFYKNGLDPGTRDCRCFSLFHIILLSLMFALYGYTLNITYYTLGAGVMIIAGFVYAVVQPYKSAYSHYTKINIAFFLLLALQYVIISGSEISSVKNHRFKWSYYIAAAICSIAPLVYFILVVSYKVVKRMKCRKWRSMFQAKKLDYEEIISQERSLLSACEHPSSLRK